MPDAARSASVLRRKIYQTLYLKQRLPSCLAFSFISTVKLHFEAAYHSIGPVLGNSAVLATVPVQSLDIRMWLCLISDEVQTSQDALEGS